MKPTVLLADAHRIFLECLSTFLEPHFSIVGATTDGRRLVELARKLRPDLIVSGIAIPLLNGIDAARKIRRDTANTKIVMLTMHSDVTYVADALDAGASAYLPKSCSGHELLKAMKKVVAGHSYVSPRIDHHALDMVRRAARRSGTLLSMRQREVLQLIAEGRSSKEIAEVMNISPRTVEFHRTTLITKLGVQRSSELIKYAVKLGLIADAIFPS